MFVKKTLGNKVGEFNRPEDNELVGAKYRLRSRDTARAVIERSVDAF